MIFGDVDCDVFLSGFLISLVTLTFENFCENQSAFDVVFHLRNQKIDDGDVGSFSCETWIFSRSFPRISFVPPPVSLVDSSEIWIYCDVSCFHFPFFSFFDVSLRFCFCF